MRRFVMDEYSALEPTSRTHAAQAFSSSTLRAIEELLPERVESSAETGCGKSTILFSNMADHHTVFALDDRKLGPEHSSVLFYEQCPLTRLDRITLVPGPTQLTLPAYERDRPLDLLLIDGPHGYPFPELEYYCLYRHLRPGALLILDDVVIPTIGRLADFLDEDEMFETVTLIDGTAIFRRTDAPTFNPLGDGWWTQRYNRRRVSPLRDIFLCDGPVLDRFSSAQLDHCLRAGEGAPALLHAGQEMRILRDAVTEQRAEIGRLKDELAELGDAAAQRDRACATITELMASRSWRITAPVRQLSSLLKKTFARDIS